MNVISLVERSIIFSILCMAYYDCWWLIMLWNEISRHFTFLHYRTRSQYETPALFCHWGFRSYFVGFSCEQGPILLALSPTLPGHCHIAQNSAPREEMSSRCHLFPVAVSLCPTWSLLFMVSEPLSLLFSLDNLSSGRWLESRLSEMRPSNTRSKANQAYPASLVHVGF